MVEYLDDLQKKDYSLYHDTIAGIRELPGDIILKYLGADVMMTLTANAVFSGTAKRLLTSMEELLGVDPVLFEKARLWEWQKRGANRKGVDIIAQYEALRYVMEGAADDVDLPSLLRTNARTGVELSQSRIDDYGLLPMVSMESFSNPDGAAEDWYYLQDGETISYGIWLDAPVAMALTYKGKPQAVIAVASNGPDELMIHQLQGVRAKRIDRSKSLYNNECIVGRVSARGLAPLKWQELMIGVGEQIARGLNKKTLGIQSGEHNKWTTTILQGEDEPHVSVKQAIEAYDVPAKRNGFERTENGNWRRPMQALGRTALSS